VWIKLFCLFDDLLCNDLLCQKLGTVKKNVLKKHFDITYGLVRKYRKLL